MTIRKNGWRDANWLIQYTIAQKWDGKLPVQMIPGSTVPLLNLAPALKQ
jgi:hypothetical protein